MIIITNKFGAPDEIVRAVKVDRHVTRGDISVTGLIDSPQIRHLKKNNDVREDVADRFYMLLGTAVHHVLELSDLENEKIKTMIRAAAFLEEDAQLDAANWIRKYVEKKYPPNSREKILREHLLHVTIDDYQISGTMDYFNVDTGVLRDFKLTSVWNALNPESKYKWAAQQNIYAYMLRKHGYQVNDILIEALFRDWSKASAGRQSNYPKAPFQTVPLDIWSDERVEDYVRSRIQLHKQADRGNVPECSPTDRWTKQEYWKVLAPNRKRSLKNCHSKKAAELYIEQHKGKTSELYIQHMPATHGRCDMYCSVKEFCQQNKKSLADAVLASELKQAS